MTFSLRDIRQFPMMCFPPFYRAQKIGRQSSSKLCVSHRIIWYRKVGYVNCNCATLCGWWLSAQSFGMSRTQCATAKIETKLAVNAWLPSQSPWVWQERVFRFLGVWTVWSLCVIMGRKGKGKILDSKPSELALVNWVVLDSSRFYNLLVVARSQTPGRNLTLATFASNVMNA